MPIGIIVNALAVAAGGLVGALFGNKVPVKIKTELTQIFKNQNTLMPEDEYMASLVTIIVLFCASATGIYGSLDAGMSGDHTILISKSILDFFTAMVFACNLGLVVSFISIPRYLIFLVIFAFAKVILPLTTPDMIADFKACGGILLFTTGLRIAKIKMYPVADMIPAMVLVMPVSWFWVNCIVPYL